MRSYCQEVLGRLRSQLPPPESGATVGVTSCRAGEGVSTWAANLAIAASNSDYESLLVHANGLGTDWILSSDEFSNTPPSQIVSTRYPFVSAAWISLYGDSKSEQIDESMPDRLASLAETYRWIWIDLPPVGVCLQHAGVLMALSSLVVVVDQKRTPQREWRRANEALQALGVPVGGVIFNRRQAPDR